MRSQSLQEAGERGTGEFTEVAEPIEQAGGKLTSREPMPPRTRKPQAQLTRIVAWDRASG